MFCLHDVSTSINLICLCSKQAWTPPEVPGWWNRLRACPRGALPNKATPLRWPGWEARKTTITVGKHAACVYKCHTDLKLTHLRFSQIICWYKSPSQTNVCVHIQKTTKEAYCICLNGCILTATHDIRASCRNLLGISEVLTSDFTLVRVRKKTTAVLLWWKVFWQMKSFTWK